jgi:DNA repair exonuclease SbcCD ATPase subunit
MGTFSIPFASAYTIWFYDEIERMSQQTVPKAAISVQNIGGIDTCEATFHPGTTVLPGRNATNRTSLLSALSGALGGSAASIKSDEKEGEVTLTLNGTEHTRRYIREEDGIRTEGDTYTHNEDVIDLFAVLLEDNPARQAVERGDDLREILMKPVDTDAIEQRIESIERERRDINERLDEIENERERLPALEECRTDLRNEYTTLETELEEVRATVEEYDANEEAAEAAEELFDELEELREDLERKRDEIETQEMSIQALRDEREELETELEELDTRDKEMDSIEHELTRLRERERGLDDTIADLSAVVEFTGGLLEDGCPDLPGAESDNDVLSGLNPDLRTVECWTCGSEVSVDEIDAQVETFRETVADRRAERQEVREQIDELQAKRDELRAIAERREKLESRLPEIVSQIDQRQDRVDQHESELETIRTEIEEIEAELEEMEELRESDLLEQYQRLSELEYERGRLDRELGDVEDRLEQLDELSNEREQLEAQRKELTEEIASLRTRIEDLEAAAVESFNEHVADVLDLLEYRNIERVWIERTEREVREGRRKVTKSVFDLHIVRATEDGSVYEDTVDTLSESEREVVGLMVALAGYLVHEVYETVPFMLLDSLEAIDSERIAALIEYFTEYAPYLVVALLPEDAAALDDEYERVPADTIAG